MDESLDDLRGKLSVGFDASLAPVNAKGRPTLPARNSTKSAHQASQRKLPPSADSEKLD